MTIAVHLVFTFKQGNQTAKTINRIYVRLLGVYQTKAAQFQICLQQETKKYIYITHHTPPRALEN
jgi:hypothetical protein